MGAGACAGVRANARREHSGWGGGGPDAALPRRENAALRAARGQERRPRACRGSAGRGLSAGGCPRARPRLLSPRRRSPPPVTASVTAAAGHEHDARAPPAHRQIQARRLHSVLRMPQLAVTASDAGHDRAVL